MADIPSIKLKTNVPLEGVVKYCDYNHSKMAKGKGWSPQLRLTGEWAGEGEARLYIPIALQDNLEAMGLIEEDGTNDWGDPAYKVKSDETIVLLKEEDPNDTKKKYTTVRYLNNGGSGPGAAEEKDAPEPEAPKPRTKSPSVRHQWQDMRDRYVACLRLADQAWAVAFGHPDKTQILESIDARVIQSTAATFYIEANKRGIPTPEVKTETAKFLDKYPWIKDGSWEHPRAYKSKKVKEKLSTQIEAMLAESTLPEDDRVQYEEIYTDMCEGELDEVTLDALKDLHADLMASIESL